MSRRMQCPSRYGAQVEAVVIGKQMVELASIARQVRPGIEDRTKGILRDGDLASDSEFTAERAANVRCGGQVIGMNMGFQYPLTLEPLLPDEIEHLIGGLCRGSCRCGIEIEHRVDHRAHLGRGIGHDIGNRIGICVEKCVYVGFHRKLFLYAG